MVIMKYKLKKTLQKMKTLFVDDESFVKNKYKKKFNKELNITNPQTFNEKINVMKINNAAFEVSKFVDKYEVRDYISKKIGDKYLVDIYGVYDYFDQDVFNSLPEQFIIKGVHGVSMNYICKNKSDKDFEFLNKNINKWLNRNAYYVSREKQYKNIKPKYIVEKLMLDAEDKSPDDYKFHCFNGKVEFVSIASSRFDENYSFTNYDASGKILPFAYNGPTNENIKQIDLSPFVDVVEKLASDFKFVRVDLYYFQNEIKFGELTFTPFNGMGVFKPDHYDLDFGKLFDIESGKSFLKD
jgi:hypothetical protein